MNIDKILQYCVYADYPVWRAHLNKYRNTVNKIILYPSRHHGIVDLEEFSKRVILETWVDPLQIDYGKEDWRQAETVPSLKYSDSEWLWFSEQDFFIKNWDIFYEDIDKLTKKSDMFGWWNETHFPYIHPCCLFIKRELFEKTTKDFRAHSEIPGCDHFAILTRDAERLGAKIVKLQDLGYEEWVNCFHLGGLTYPYQNFDGQNYQFGVKRPEVFYVYNYWMSRVLIEQHPDFVKLSEKIERVIEAKPQCISINPETSKWKEYFI